MSKLCLVNTNANYTIHLSRKRWWRHKSSGDLTDAVEMSSNYKIVTPAMVNHGFDSEINNNVETSIGIWIWLVRGQIFGLQRIWSHDQPSSCKQLFLFLILNIWKICGDFKVWQLLSVVDLERVLLTSDIRIPNKTKFDHTMFLKRIKHNDF